MVSHAFTLARQLAMPTLRSHFAASISWRACGCVLLPAVLLVGGCSKDEGAGGDTTAPSVVSVTPSQGSTNIAVSTTVSVNFSEPIACVTVIASSFTLSSTSGPVSGNVTCSGSSATFTPAATLSIDTTYTITITTAVQDPAGNHLASAFTSSFTTAPGPAPATYTVGGNVTGLGAGKSVTIQNNGTDNTIVATNASFTFDTAIAGGGAYNVTVHTHPLAQTCFVSNGIGTIADANITNIGVNCATNSYTIGGNVSGLASGRTVTLLLNKGAETKTVATNGNFTFDKPVESEKTYSVEVLTQPAAQTCTVTNGSGNVAASTISNISVSCIESAPAAPQVTLQYGYRQLRFAWPVVDGATHYRVLENPDGVSGFTQVGVNLVATTYDHTIVLYKRLNARYIIEACNLSGCADSAQIFLASGLIPAIGYVKASNTESLDYFGSAIALSADGNTLAVGAPYEDSALYGVLNGTVNEATAGNGTQDSGAVYVFIRSGNIWTQHAYLKAPSSQAYSYFGASLAISANGNRLVVGMPGADLVTPSSIPPFTITHPDAGLVCIFNRDSGNSFGEPSCYPAPNWEQYDNFGSSVALSSDGNTLAVGAPNEDSAQIGITSGSITEATAGNGAIDSGAVYVGSFDTGSGMWIWQAYAKTSNTESGDRFGGAIALSADGNTLAVGASYEDSALTGITAGSVNETAAGNGAFESGAVYVFTRSGGTWTQQAYVKASNTASGIFGEYFGSAIALSTDGNTLAVGAYGEDGALTGVTAGSVNETTTGNGVDYSGAVYVFTRSGGTWTQQAYAKASNTESGDRFGGAIALSADGNTLAVGASYEDSALTGITAGSVNETAAGNGAFESGAVYVFTRSGGTWTQQAYVKASNTAALGGDGFGAQVALSVDGTTMAVGATGEDSNATGFGGSQTNNSATDSGAVYLY